MQPDERLKPHRPPNTSLRQQRMKAWQPLITPKSVLPTLFIVGFLFAPIGAFLLHTASTVSELVIDYTDCGNTGSAFTPMPSSQVSYAAPGGKTVDNSMFRWKYEKPGRSFSGLKDSLTIGVCSISFEIPAKFLKPVFFYYRLSNFYQNHRQYVKSLSASQLAGENVAYSSIKSSCDSWGTVAGSTNKVYYPCGLIASSFFNDSFTELTNLDLDAPVKTYKFDDQEIAWPSDSAKYSPLKSFDPEIHVPPVSWQDRYGSRYELIDGATAPNVVMQPRFWVWMRTAGLPTFRKLWGRNGGQDLEAGIWQLSIEDTFPVLSYGGRKAIVLSTVSFLGGRNVFLGWAYIVVGCLCVCIAVLFAVRHLLKPRKLGDHTYLSWNQQPQQQQQQTLAQNQPSNAVNATTTHQANTGTAGPSN